MLLIRIFVVFSIVRTYFAERISHVDKQNVRWYFKMSLQRRTDGMRKNRKTIQSAVSILFLLFFLFSFFCMEECREISVDTLCFQRENPAFLSQRSSAVSDMSVRKHQNNTIAKTAELMLPPIQNGEIRLPARELRSCMRWGTDWFHPYMGCLAALFSALFFSCRRLPSGQYSYFRSLFLIFLFILLKKDGKSRKLLQQ